ncbi:T9SS type A sorting domain-containing protein [Hymenobacter busanensis]|uniref:T9SS type A sorting domain-containing protein n=1 Tax=Hymenobacter busanensis TaxID=2607656 RepID=A0A7L4ZV18_9BACT|nr:T9SS type A sorting domain-containing protein [Hymenobacter busanensis]KAA9327619.1 T9SS type A sorting domain-containing protein [Hymenobacter busanensis]QHJ06042.1 hypothetical protein GUY19_01520 [Hymenobacter busanensis]
MLLIFRSLLTRFCGFWLLALLLAGSAQAQTPAWQAALSTSQSTNGSAWVNSSAADASGNVYLAGEFNGTLTLGTTTLTSPGYSSTNPGAVSMFLAKWSPSANRFLWAIRGGGPGFANAGRLAVNGTSLYVAGTFVGPNASFGAVTLTNSTSTPALFLLKLTDTGTGAAAVWGQTMLTNVNNVAYADLAVEGNAVYLSGNFSGSVLTIGTYTMPNQGAINSYDGFIAKFTDAGATGSFTWAQQLGGPDEQEAGFLAVSGTSVYMAGAFRPASLQVGATVLTNASLSGSDVYVAKLTDAGASSSFVWALRAGGTGYEHVDGLKASGSGIYLLGGYDSPTAGFGTINLARTATDGGRNMYLTKLADAGPTGAYVWALPAGGTTSVQSRRLAVQGSSVYVAGIYANATTPSFGSITLQPSPGNAPNQFVTKILDGGSSGGFQWAYAGTQGNIEPRALTPVGATVFTSGVFGTDAANPTARFDNITLTAAATARPTAFLAALRDPMPSAVRQAAQPSLTLHPNPAHGTSRFAVAPEAAHRTLQVLDGTGRELRRQAVLPHATMAVVDLRGLAPGLYLVRCGTALGRLEVQ